MQWIRTRSNHFFCFIITLLLLLAYSNSFKDSFQHDDIHTIVRNPFIKDPGRIPHFFVDPQMGSGIYNETSGYRPLLLATFAVNYYFGGLDVFGYHLFNFILHLLCTLLVYFVILYLFRFANLPIRVHPLRYQMTALFAALAFGLHPVQTESVTYITGRSSAMMALFFLASFFTYMQFHLTRKVGYLLLSTLTCACALLTKETAITLFPILLVFNLLFPHGDNVKRRYLSLLPHFLLTLLYLMIRIYFFGSLQYGAQPVRPFYDNLLSQFRAWIHYLGTLILPLALNIDYDFPVSHSILETQVVLSIFLLAAISLLIWRLSRSDRLIGFFALWFAINLFPTNSIIALEDLISDRWLYLSSVGYAVLLALAASWIFQKWVEAGSRIGKIVFFFFCALVIEFYGFSTLLRNFDWTNQQTLWEDAVAKSPAKARPYNGLGLALVLQGRLEKGKEAFQHAIRLEPQGGQPYLNLGYVYSLEENWDKAIEYYERAIPFCPGRLSDIYSRMGLIYLRQQKMEDAEKYLRKAIEIRPHNAIAHCNLGLYFEERGDVERAISHLEKANKLDPDYLLPYEGLSRLYKRKGLSEKSQEVYRQLLRISKPGSKD